MPACASAIGSGSETGSSSTLTRSSAPTDFSYAPDLASPTAFVPGMVVTRVHSLGTVEIADEVEIGACTTIDRSTVETTRIGRATKIDNHVHIGHNVTVGESCMICGMVGISGSVRIGDRVRLGGGVGVADHVAIGDQAVVAAGSGVAGNVAAGTFVSGFPAQLHQRIDGAVYTTPAGRSACMERLMKSARGLRRSNGR